MVETNNTNKYDDNDPTPSSHENAMPMIPKMRMHINANENDTDNVVDDGTCE